MKPIAVLISDIHFTPATLELASSALRQAKAMAAALNVPLVLTGDTLDSKAIIRGECANRLIEIMTEEPESPNPAPRQIVLVGNHDLINEKGKAHSLNFLAPYADIIQHPVYDSQLGAHLIPYQTSLGELQTTLAGIDSGSRIICHQGIHGADMGHYVQDKTSLSAEHFANFRTVSGHYHKRQDIKCGLPRKGAVGLFSYIGNPYSLSFGEANDGPKGFQVLMGDGSLEFIPTNLRKHVVLNITTEDVGHDPHPALAKDDLLWVKLKGPHAELIKIKKSDLSAWIDRPDFKLDKIHTDQPVLDASTKPRTDAETMDAVIDASDDTAEAKAELKALWRELT